jgi:hypothetical protein
MGQKELTIRHFVSGGLGIVFDPAGYEVDRDRLGDRMKSILTRDIPSRVILCPSDMRRCVSV